MFRTFIIVSAISVVMLISCEGDSSDTAENSEKTETSEVNEEIELIEVDEPNLDVENDEYSVDDQWSDLILQLQTDNPNESVKMFVDKTHPSFSEAEWSYVDLKDPEYLKAFQSFSSFDDLPEADYFSEGAKVITVQWNTDDDMGNTFESTSMIYLEVRDGLIWIIGSAMAG